LPVNGKTGVEQDSFDHLVVDSCTGVILSQVPGTDDRSSVIDVTRSSEFAGATENAREEIGAIVEELR
jgi:hypothetical protein